MNSNGKILIVDSTVEKHFSEPDLEARILSDFKIELIHIASAQELTQEILQDVNIIILWACIPAIQFNTEIFERMPNCHTIIKAAVGYDNVNLPEAREHNINVYNTPDYGTEEVADHSMALLLALQKQLLIANDHVKNGGWDWSVVRPLKRLRGQKLGLIGFGRIGMAMARKASAFGMDVSFYDPNVVSGMDKATGTRRCEHLTELLAEADILSVHCSLNETSKQILNKTAFGLMKTGVSIVNTARGGVIENAALIDALQCGKVASVGLDVVAGEPDIPQRLLATNKVIMTPHSAFYTEEAFIELRTKPAEMAKAILNNIRVRNLVN